MFNTDHSPHSIPKLASFKVRISPCEPKLLIVSLSTSTTAPNDIRLHAGERFASQASKTSRAERSVASSAYELHRCLERTAAQDATPLDLEPPNDDNGYQWKGPAVERGKRRAPTLPQVPEDSDKDGWKNDMER